MSLSIRSASETAAMIVENVTLYSKEKHHDTPLPRFKMPDNAIRRISGHARVLPESYVEQLYIELQQLDWIMMRYNTGEFFFLHCSIPQNWTRLSAKRVVPIEDPDGEPYDYSPWSLRDLQEYAKRYDFLQPDTEGFDDREKLIAAIERGEQQ